MVWIIPIIRIIQIIRIIRIIQIIRMLYILAMLYFTIDTAPMPHQNRCTEWVGGLQMHRMGLQKQPRDRLDGRRSRTASGSGPQ